MLLDLIRPTRGRVEVLGIDPRRGGADAPPAHRLRPGRSRDVQPADRPAAPGVLRRAARHAELCAGRGVWPERLDVALDRPIGTLSRGNRQKIGVVQAFAHEPELLVLDEPTSGLDPVSQRTFRSLVREATARGAAVLLSSHVLSEVQRVADRVAIVRAGQLVTIEPMRELEAKALRVVEIRFGGPVPAQTLREPARRAQRRRRG